MNARDATNAMCHPRNILSPALLAVFVLFGVGCPGITPGSRPYRPLPQWEAKFSAQARRDVFPDDVRQSPETFNGTLVTWTGVITRIEFIPDGEDRLARITADHHYFDWIEDIGIQRERFFLSPRGEGHFAVQWVVRPDDQSQRFIDQFAFGDMLIAYGYPTVVRPEYVGLNPTQNMRAIKPLYFRTDVLDYGRPGDPVTVLKTAW